jgi:hypothetical protein
MGLITKTNLLSVADRIGKRYLIMRQAATDGSPLGANGPFYDRCHVTTGDQVVEIPTLSVAYTSDQGWLSSSVDTIADAFISAVSASYSVIGGITQHFARAGLTGGWSQYLDSVTGNVSESFRKTYSKAGGSVMKARNVFYDLPTDWVFGSGLQNAGVLDFTAGTSFGDQAGAADGTRFAATQLRVKTTSAIGGTDLDVVITGKDKNNVTATVNVTIPNGTGSGTYIDCGTSTDLFINVTGIAFGTNHGTTADAFNIVNKIERAVAL